ncbi:DUF6320 domain-containing protein [Terrimonas alba]|uniref:DUF6320 domain-containing protein n=1 Tax=Terrimonas alba TaxID=3349636 RepID=UPI0035F37DA0
MIICKNCGVQLEADMQHCPLCGQAVKGNGTNEETALYPPQPMSGRNKLTEPQKKFTWEIISLILLSAIAATFIIDFIINRKITWSEYPAAISLIIFSYISLFAFSQQNSFLQMLIGFVLSSVSMIVLDALTGGLSWAIQLGIPLLLATNLIVAVMLAIIRGSKYKGINLLAWAFLGTALLSICIEAILSYYQMKAFRFTWSVIVGGCIVPVVLVLLFVHFRLKKGRSLKKTFHI